MSLAAVKSPYILFVTEDEDPVNPRKDYDNFGKMTCWHRGYNLGDKHDYEDSADLFRELIRNSVSEKDIIQYAKDGNARYLKLEYNKSAHAWDVVSFWDMTKNWYTESFPGTLEENRGMICDEILAEMRNDDLKTLAEKTHIIKPLYLYDHSGIRMSTGSFIGRAQHAEWDSGQIGWIYASHKDIEKEYEIITPETIEKANRLLENEVKLYDAYISGQCYGFLLYKDGEEIDSCWGFLGDADDIKESIKEYLEETARGLVDNLDYTDTAIDEILMEESEYEDEEI